MATPQPRPSAGRGSPARPGQTPPSQWLRHPGDRSRSRWPELRCLTEGTSLVYSRHLSLPGRLFKDNRLRRRCDPFADSGAARSLTGRCRENRFSGEIRTGLLPGGPRGPFRVPSPGSGSSPVGQSGENRFHRIGKRQEERDASGEASSFLNSGAGRFQNPGTLSSQ